MCSYSSNELWLLPHMDFRFFFFSSEIRRLLHEFRYPQWLARFYFFAHPPLPLSGWSLTLHIQTFGDTSWLRKFTRHSLGITIGKVGRFSSCDVLNKFFSFFLFVDRQKGFYHGPLFPSLSHLPFRCSFLIHEFSPEWRWSSLGLPCLIPFSFLIALFNLSVLPFTVCSQVSAYLPFFPSSFPPFFASFPPSFFAFPFTFFWAGQVSWLRRSNLKSSNFPPLVKAVNLAYPGGHQARFDSLSLSGCPSCAAHFSMSTQFLLLLIRFFGLYVCVPFLFFPLFPFSGEALSLISPLTCPFRNLAGSPRPTRLPPV